MSRWQALKARVMSVFRNVASERHMTIGRLNDFFTAGSYGSTADALSEITYYTCLKVLSESVGKMPMYLIDEHKRRIADHALNALLANRPNDFQTPSRFFTLMEFWRNHFGNAYAYIKRDPRGALESLLPLDPRRVQVWINNTTHWTSRRFYYSYTDPLRGSIEYIKPEEMIHVTSWLLDDNQLLGRSVREILATSLAGAKASNEFLNDLYQRGLLARAVIKYVGDLKPASQEALLNRLEEQANANGRRMIALPIGFDIQSLDMKLTDTQFFDLRRYSAQQIAAAFGVEPIQLNDYSKASYQNSTAQNLSFYVDTLLVIVSQYEQEFRAKLLTPAETKAGWRLKFNVGVILRADPSAQAEIIAKLLATGVYTIDEARALLDREPCEDELGKTHLINGAYRQLKELFTSDDDANT